MKRFKLVIPLTIAAQLIGAGCASTATSNTNTTNTVVNTNTTVTNISYTGVQGKNALELLQAAHTVDVSSAGFVNAIDGVKPVGRQYWALYVNNTLADKGAKDIQTKTTDSISWKLESY